MARNPHFDRETITEDIGFQGPHSDFNNYVAPFDDEVTISDIPSAYDNRWQQGYFSDPDFGPAGGPPEITDVPSAYDNRWQQGYFSNPHFGPAGGPQGIETLSPPTFPGLGNLPVSQPWTTGFKTGMMDNDMMDEIELAKIYTSDMPGMQDPGTNLGFFSSDNFFDQLTPQGKAINDALDTLNSHGLDLQGMLDQGYSRDAIYDMIPASIKQNLPRDAFETISDFRGQQPITVI